MKSKKTVKIKTVKEAHRLVVNTYDAANSLIERKLDEVSDSQNWLLKARVLNMLFCRHFHFFLPTREPTKNEIELQYIKGVCKKKGTKRK